MGTQADQLDDDVTLLDASEAQEGAPVAEAEEQGAQDAAGAVSSGEPDATAAAEAEAEELVVTIGDEKPAADDEELDKAPQWVRDVRKQNREMARALREREAEIARLRGATGQAQAVTLGPKPTLEGCDFDTEVFEQRLEQWHEAKRQADEQKAKAEEAQRTAEAEWKGKLDAFGKAKATLKVRDFDDAQAVVEDTFSVVQQGIILKGVRDANTAALLVYALGKNSAKAKELAAMKDPVEFAVAIGELKTMIKTQPRKSAPLPERTIRGSAPGAAAVDRELERLRADADRTGDRTKVAAYLRQQKAKQR